MFNKDYGLIHELYKTSQVWAQTCEHSKVHKFKLVKFREVHKFGPKLVNFLNNSQLRKVTSLGPNLWTFLIIPN